MENKDFNPIVEEFLDNVRKRMPVVLDMFLSDIRKMLISKGSDYAGKNPDRLVNFKEVAIKTEVNPLKVWEIYVGKHDNSIHSYIQDPRPMNEDLYGRFLDRAVYDVLGYALYLNMKELTK